jgi:sigma-B regulation protein RsbU (phosphoserine phosphatase)
MDKCLNVLIIEDSEDDALFLLRELRRYGYEPSSLRVDTAEAMREALATREWEIVFSDFVMPKFSGLAALVMLKESNLDLPFIIVSGKIGEETAAQLMKAGAHDYILKGNLARLAPVIEREMHEAGERRKRKESEEALREVEKRFRATFEYAASGITHFDINGQFLRVNQKLCDLTGYTRGELDATTFYEITHPDDSDVYLDCTRQLLAGKSPVFPIKNRYLRKNGSYFWASLTLSLVCKTTQEPDYFIAIIEDISERKRMEEELAEKIVQLEAALAKVKQLEGIIPICMYCKKIRDDHESWHQLERYITEHTEAFFSHGVCPECHEKAMNEIVHLQREIISDGS